eukprot:g78739.t1
MFFSYIKTSSHESKAQVAFTAADGSRRARTSQQRRKRSQRLMAQDELARAQAAFTPVDALLLKTSSHESTDTAQAAFTVVDGLIRAQTSGQRRQRSQIEKH